MSSSQPSKPFYKPKFPIARIKKIMQADEEVGKVAQVTPVVVSKALELFMQSIVDETVKQARIKQAKKVTITHMKTAIQSADQFDFLIDIIDKYTTNTGSFEKDIGNSSEKIQENKDGITFLESNSSKKKISN